MMNMGITRLMRRLLIEEEGIDEVTREGGD